MKLSLIAKSYPISLFVTGNSIESACRRYCDKKGLCVTITGTNYVFKGGNEYGYVIGLINYPRFTKTPAELMRIALDLGEFLIKECNPNGSFTMQTPDGTYFFSNRESDL